MTLDLKTIFNISNELDSKGKNFINIMTAALEKSNLPGFDYLEFKQSMAALEKMNMDKATAIKSAFATASTVGLTKEKLLQTADHYRNILNEQKSEFDDALQNQVRLKVEGKKQEVASLRKKIAEHKAAIEKLESEIHKSQKTIDSSDKDIQVEEDKIAKTKGSFETVYKSILQIISTDMESFNQHL